MRTTTLDGFDMEMRKILREFNTEEVEKIEEITLDVAKQCRKQIRQNAKGQQGRARNGKSWSEYISGWNYKKMGRGKFKVLYHVHNQSKPGLAHLLEFGHEKANQYGEYSGITNKYPHFMPAEATANDPRHRMPHRPA